MNWITVILCLEPIKIQYQMPLGQCPPWNVNLNLKDSIACLHSKIP